MLIHKDDLCLCIHAHRHNCSPRTIPAGAAGCLFLRTAADPRRPPPTPELPPREPITSRQQRCTQGVGERSQQCGNQSVSCWWRFAGWRREGGPGRPRVGPRQLPGRITSIHGNSSTPPHSLCLLFPPQHVNCPQPGGGSGAVRTQAMEIVGICWLNLETWSQWHMEVIMIWRRHVGLKQGNGDGTHGTGTTSKIRI